MLKSKTVLSKLVVVCASLMCAVGIGQLWFDLFSPDTFIKIVITLAAIALLMGLIIAVNTDLGSDEKLKKDKYLD